MKTILFLLLASTGIAQTPTDNIDSSEVLIFGYYSIKPDYFDSVENLIIENNLIDSTSIEYESFFNMDNVRKNCFDFHSEGFCFFIDGFSLNRVKVLYLKRKVKCKTVEYGYEKYRLTHPLFLSTDLFYYGLDYVKMYDQPSPESNTVYEHYETDRHGNYNFLETNRDSLGRSWVKVEFNCSRYHNGNGIKTFTVKGWTLLSSLHIAYDCN